MTDVLALEAPNATVDVAAVTGYSVAIGPRTAADPISEVSFDAVRLAMNLDDGNELGFSISATDPAAQYLDELATDVWLFRGGAVWQRHRIVQLNQAWGPNGDDTITVRAVDYRRLLSWRFTQGKLTYTQVAQGEIMARLIDHTQAQPNGNLGITRGNLGTPVVRDRVYAKGVNIGEMLANLAGVQGGCSLWVDGDRKLQCRTTAEFNRHTVPLVLGANALALSRDGTSTTYGNVVTATGDDTKTVPVTVSSPTLTTDPRGRWERQQSFTSVIIQATLVENANGALTDARLPDVSWSADLSPLRYMADSNYAVGDFVTLAVPPTTVGPVGAVAPGATVSAQVIALDVTLTADAALDVSAALIQYL